MSNLDVSEQILIEQVVANEAPSAGVAYLLAIFLGLVSGHRFYLRRPTSAVLQILSYFIFIGFFWLLLDLFLIPGMVRSEQERIRRRETLRRSVNHRPDIAATPAPAPVEQVSAELLDRLLAHGAHDEH